MGMQTINRASLSAEKISDDDAGFFPTLNELLAAADLPGSALDERNTVSVSSSFLRLLISELLLRQSFNEVEYRKANPDVDLACESGEINSAHEHYARTGYFEGRSLGDAAVDAQWYLAAYPDLAIAKQNGDIEDLVRHFNDTGRLEGRVCSSRQLLEKRRWDTLLAT